MTDIVERLRSLANCDARAGAPLGACMEEAADEIERLRRREAFLMRTLGWPERGQERGEVDDYCDHQIDRDVEALGEEWSQNRMTSPNSASKRKN